MTLPSAAYGAIAAKLATLPCGATASVPRWCAAAIRAALRKDTAATITRYYPVVRAVAARAFRACHGEVPFDELLSAASEEALKGAARANGQGSPAPLIRTWATWGCRALIEQRRREPVAFAEAPEVSVEMADPDLAAAVATWSATLSSADQGRLRRVLAGDKSTDLHSLIDRARIALGDYVD